MANFFKILAIMDLQIMAKKKTYGGHEILILALNLRASI